MQESGSLGTAQPRLLCYWVLWPLSPPSSAFTPDMGSSGVGSNHGNCAPFLLVRSRMGAAGRGIRMLGVRSFLKVCAWPPESIRRLRGLQGVSRKFRGEAMCVKRGRPWGAARAGAGLWPLRSAVSADHEPLPEQVPEPTGPGSAIPLSAGDRVAVPRYEAGRDGGTRILMEQAK